jgi:small basic protein
VIKNNKIISLTVIGLVIGLILGVVVNSPNANVAVLLPLGGIVGFVAGWVWQTRSPEAK